MVLANEVLLLGQAPADDDTTDWEAALAEMRPSFSMCRHSVLSKKSEVLVINESVPCALLEP